MKEISVVNDRIAVVAKPDTSLKLELPKGYINNDSKMVVVGLGPNCPITDLQLGSVIEVGVLRGVPELMGFPLKSVEGYEKLWIINPQSVLLVYDEICDMSTL